MGRLAVRSCRRVPCDRGGRWEGLVGWRLADESARALVVVALSSLAGNDGIGRLAVMLLLVMLLAVVVVVVLVVAVGLGKRWAGR